jgi:hypothetical protein
MAKKWELECEVCKKIEHANDTYDISQLHWTVLAWIVPDGNPRVVCPKCEYGKPKIKI